MNRFGTSNNHYSGITLVAAKKQIADVLNADERSLSGTTMFHNAMLTIIGLRENARPGRNVPSSQR